MAKKKQTKTNDPVEVTYFTKYDRFDLEQQIIRCWEVLQDIKKYNVDSNSEVKDEYLNAVTEYYEPKFQELWDIFSDLVHTKKLT